MYAHGRNTRSGGKSKVLDLTKSPEAAGDDDYIVEEVPEDDEPEGVEQTEPDISVQDAIAKELATLEPNTGEQLIFILLLEVF